MLEPHYSGFTSPKTEEKIPSRTGGAPSVGKEIQNAVRPWYHYESEMARGSRKKTKKLYPLPHSSLKLLPPRHTLVRAFSAKGLQGHRQAENHPPRFPLLPGGQAVMAGTGSIDTSVPDAPPWLLVGAGAISGSGIWKSSCGKAGSQHWCAQQTCKEAAGLIPSCTQSASAGLSWAPRTTPPQPSTSPCHCSSSRSTPPEPLAET